MHYFIISSKRLMVSLGDNLTYVPRSSMDSLGYEKHSPNETPVLGSLYLFWVKT